MEWRGLHEKSFDGYIFFLIIQGEENTGIKAAIKKETFNILRKI